MGTTGLRFFVLILDQFVGSALETMVAVAAWQGQGVDQGVGGGADLAQGDLRVFPPATAPFGGTGISDSTGSRRGV